MLTLPGLNNGNTQTNYLDGSVGYLNYDLTPEQEDLIAGRMGQIAGGAAGAANQVARIGGAGGAARANYALAQGATDMALADAELRNLFAQQDLDAQALRLQNAQAGEGARQFDASLAENTRQFDAGLAEDTRQFDAGLAEQGRQFDAGMAFNQDELEFRYEELRSTANSLADQLGVERDRIDVGLLETMLNAGFESGVNLLDYPDTLSDLMRRFL